MKQYLVGPYARRRIFPKDALLIGVDRGAWHLAKYGITMRYAIGDFDSVSGDEFRVIQEHATEIIILPTNKDETDLEAALKRLTKPGETWIAEGFLNGPRLDHLFLTVLLLLKYADRHVLMLNATNRMEVLTTGTHSIQRSKIPYVSFFSLEPMTLSLDQGFRYPLTNQTFDSATTLGISNELVAKQGSVQVVGKCVMIRSAETKKKEGGLAFLLD